MKRMIMTIVAILTIAVSADAMSYEQARREALFLTDKMAYELNLDDRQYDAAYEINLDYLLGVTSRDDVYGTYWSRRNLDLSYILLDWQWNAFCAATYFYRPLYWHSGYWHFGIYARYPRRNYFYFSRPTVYISYRGGHSWRSNGGRSYYESRRHDFRPHPDRHHGLRDRWDSGDIRRNSGNGFNSSTRVTVNNNDRHNTSARPNTGSSKTSGSFSGSRSSETTTRQSASPSTGSGSRTGGPFGTPSRPSASPSTGSGSRTGGSFGTSRTTGHNVTTGTSSVRTATNAGTRFSTASQVERSSAVKSSSSIRNTNIRPATPSVRTSGTSVRSSSSSVRSSGMSSMRNSGTSVRSSSMSPRPSSSHHSSSGNGARTSGSFGGHR